jgi:anti-anti-sigma factor
VEDELMAASGSKTPIRVAAGALSGVAALRMAARLRRAAEEGEAVLLDLSRVRSIDGVGLHALVAGYQAAEQHRVGFALTAVPAALMRRLEWSGLACVFEVVASPDCCLPARAAQSPGAPQ